MSAHTISSSLSGRGERLEGLSIADDVRIEIWNSSMLVCSADLEGRKPEDRSVEWGGIVV